MLLLHYNFQKEFALETVNSYQLSVISYQLSVISYQLFVHCSLVTGTAAGTGHC